MIIKDLAALERFSKNFAEFLKSSLEDDKNAEVGVSLHLDGRVAKRTSSRLRRTNDRSVSGVISGDAEDASHVSGSYPSKQKYKLDSSSLHEDHEDDENAEIGVPLHAPFGEK